MKEDKTKLLNRKLELLLRLRKLSNRKVLYIPYKPSQKERYILNWFTTLSGTEIAKKLKINRSYIYVVLKKFKNIYTKEEVYNKEIKESEG